MSLSRIWAIAANGFREVIRDRILYFIGFFALLQIFALRFVPAIAVSTQDKILLDLGLGAIEILSVVVAIFVGTALINKEIEKRTVLVLIPKPLSRTELILGKHLGLSAVLAVMVALMAAIYLILISWSGISYPLGTILVSLAYLLIELALLTAVAMLFGVFTSSILATLLSFGIYLMGNSSSELVKLGQLTKNDSVEFLAQIIYFILPDLSRLNLKNGAVYAYLPDFSQLVGNAFYGLIYTVLLLAIAIIIFSRREF